MAGLLFPWAIIPPKWVTTSRAMLLGFGTRLQFVFLPYCAGFTGGHQMGRRARPALSVAEATLSNFAHFNGTEAYCQFPSPCSSRDSRGISWRGGLAAGARVVHDGVLAVLIAIKSPWCCWRSTPATWFAGALIGVIGAMLWRYWFACPPVSDFAIRRGAMAPLYRCRTLAEAPQKGLPAAPQPLRSGRRKTPDIATGRRPSNQEC